MRNIGGGDGGISELLDSLLEVIHESLVFSKNRLRIFTIFKQEETRHARNFVLFKNIFILISIELD